jgi:predicted small secreted protein
MRLLSLTAARQPGTSSDDEKKGIEMKKVFLVLVVAVVGGILLTGINAVVGVTVDGSFAGKVIHVAAHAIYGMFIYETFRSK